MSGTLRIEKVVTSGVFSLDGQDFDVDNNVWLIGDDDEVLVVDASHQAQPIIDAIGSRSLLGVVCTHGHNDHINAALAVASGAPVHLHPDDRMLWDVVNPGHDPLPLADGQTLTVAGAEVQVLHTPGHSPGAVCLYVPSLNQLVSGDTLFCGGPGATGRSFSSFPVILDSIRTRLLTLPAETEVLTGHGDSTSIGAEGKDYDDWVTRGH
ncbi:MBL fold metallo-hydrolase [Kineosporia succinea]|uniref:Glyoxylase-like metal-dependent hydrolase (Beta-lactamase superfamily II) n=1 Tax=Kineosporia succinea TaxID=84632 RepID=A0ABT9P626_9ACTN|nr:MBL fold metallo-hydrolase [Kineosporia succinea]MDP9828138.1 glyoxylase-like metal-dependent hydrolase (beta-lactamase superfamily II) [Kineosporia succinea]